jgi:hypothetical protein
MEREDKKLRNTSMFLSFSSLFFDEKFSTLFK